MREIESCPFCGFKDGEVRFERGQHFVYCNCCECYGPTSPMRRRAVGAWNRWRDKACPECGGTKKVTVAQHFPEDGEPYREEDCGACE